MCILHKILSFSSETKSNINLFLRIAKYANDINVIFLFFSYLLFKGKRKYKNSIKSYFILFQNKPVYLNNLTKHSVSALTLGDPIPQKLFVPCLLGCCLLLGQSQRHSYHLLFVFTFSARAAVALKLWCALMSCSASCSVMFTCVLQRLSALTAHGETEALGRRPDQYSACCPSRTAFRSPAPCK